MTARRVNSSLLYTSGTPAKWLRAVATQLDQSVALLCAHQWRCMQALPIAGSANAYRHRR
jgi:hypothetical protein